MPISCGLFVSTRKRASTTQAPSTFGGVCRQIPNREDDWWSTAHAQARFGNPSKLLERDEIVQGTPHGRAKRVQVWIERPRWPRLHLAMKLAGHCCLNAICALPEATARRGAIKSKKVMRSMPSVRTQTRHQLSLNIWSPSGLVRCLACRRLLKLCRNN